MFCEGKEHFKNCTIFYELQMRPWVTGVGHYDIDYLNLDVLRQLQLVVICNSIRDYKIKTAIALPQFFRIP